MIGYTWKDEGKVWEALFSFMPGRRTKMKQKIRRVMEKIMIILMCIMTAGNFLPVHAADEEDRVWRTWEGWKHDQSVMDTDDYEYLKWARTCFFDTLRYKRDNAYRISYCLDPNKSSNTVGYTSKLFKDWDGMSQAKKQRISELSYFGYMYPGHEDVRWRVATQTAIWEYVSGLHFASRYDPDENRPDDSPITEYDDVSGLVRQINQMADAYENLKISFEVYHQNGKKAEQKDGRWQIAPMEVAEVKVSGGNLKMLDITSLPSGFTLCSKSGQAIALDQFDETKAGDSFYVKTNGNSKGKIGFDAYGADRDVAQQQFVFVHATDQNIIVRSAMMTRKTFSMDVEADAVPLYFEKKDAVSGKSLAGAEFSIYDNGWKLVESLKSADQPVQLKTELYKSGVKYFVVETNIPSGYAAEEVKKDADGNDVKKPDSVKGTVIAVFEAGKEKNYRNGTAMLVTAANSPRTEIRIQKTDPEGKPLAGCHLQLIDKDGNTVEEWDTDKEAHTVNAEYAPGAEYSVRETSAARGYYQAQEQKITLDASFEAGRVYEVTMQDKPIDIGVMKQDEKGKPLSGASFVLFDRADNSEVLKWKSDGTEKKIGEYLKAGHTYILRETDMTDGYYLAEDQIIEVPEKDGGKPVLVTVKNEQIVYELVKTDNNGKPLAGAKMKLFDVSDRQTGLADAEPVLSFTSGNEPFVTSLLKRGHTYRLVETEPPGGYRPSSENDEYRISDISMPAEAGMAVYKEFTVPEKHKGKGRVTVTFTDHQIIYHFAKTDPDGKALKGASLKLTDITSSGHPEIIREWTSSGKPEKITALTAGHTYRFEETAAPQGWYTAEPQEFTVNGYDEKEITLTAVDQPTVLEILKTDETGKPAAGAELAVFQSEDIENGKIREGAEPVHSFVSTERPAKVSGILKAGGKYIIHEVSAPAGYYYADDIEVQMPDSYPGRPVRVVMKDEQIRLQVRKIDESGKQLEGAKLVLKDENENNIAETETVREPWDISGIVEAGKTYILHEEEYVRGHYLAKDVKFTVSRKKADEEVTVQDMVDETIRIKVRKVDETGTMLEGAHITLTDIGTGEVVDEWDTVREEHDISDVVVPGHRYILKENEIVGGHYIAKDIQFTVEEYGQKQEVEIIDMVDVTTQLKIMKVDDKDGKIVSGVTLKLWDVTDPGNETELSGENGWITDDQPLMLKGIVTGGHDYRLQESEYVNGVYQAADVFFSIPQSGTAEPVVITMVDETTDVSFRKTGPEGRMLSGAVMQILDEEGNVVHEWTSGEEAEDLSAYVKGDQTYVLHEKTAPFGYRCGRDVRFTVSGKKDHRQALVMIDERADLKVRVVKQDAADRHVLADAEFAVFYEDGTKVIDEKGNQVTVRTNGKGEAYFTVPYDERGYFIREISAPPGYHLNRDKHHIVIPDDYRFDSDEAVTAVVLDQGKVPYTGLFNPVFLLIPLLAIVLFAADRWKKL